MKTSPKFGSRRISAVTIVVPDYDQAIAFFCDVLQFALIEDKALSDAKRWVLVAPDPNAETRFLLDKAVGPEQKAAIGHQTGGRVGFFLQTSDFDADYAQFLAAGLEFREAPRSEPYGKVAVFADPWGNTWDLIEFT